MEQIENWFAYRRKFVKYQLEELWIAIYEQREKELRTDRSSFCNILGPNISSYFKRQPVAISQRLKINKQFVRKNKWAMLDIFARKIRTEIWGVVGRGRRSNKTMTINNLTINDTHPIQHHENWRLKLNNISYLKWKKRD